MTIGDLKGRKMEVNMPLSSKENHCF